MVDQSLVGLIVGVQGSQVKRIQDQFNVHVIVDRASAGGDKRKITISGANEQSVDEAIEEILIERAHLPIETHMIEYVCGHNDKNLGFFYEKSEVV
jgi:hypothetical protein